MIKTSLLRYAAIGMATVSMAGFAAASTVSFNDATTGPDSHASVSLSNSFKHSTTNVNEVGVGNYNGQGAASGSVDASKNTEVGAANGSGDAKNTNSTETDVAVQNGGGAAVSALAGMGAGLGDQVSFNGATTGPDSKVNVDVKNSASVKVVNENVVQVENINEQTAVSGDVSAYKNTKVGGLKSGDATNTNGVINSVVIGN